MISFSVITLSFYMGVVLELVFVRVGFVCGFATRFPNRFTLCGWRVNGVFALLCVWVGVICWVVLGGFTFSLLPACCFAFLCACCCLFGV